MAAVEKAQAGTRGAPVDLTPFAIDPAIKVSVLMLAYNHEPFIRQAVESALAQETPFVYEIVIGEDCSTDATRAVLVELAQQHPDKIRLLLRESNLGMHRNFVDTLRECRGEYVAFLEGDDFWVSPHKLAIQAEILDADPEVVMCGHNIFVLEEGESAPTQVKVPKGQYKPRMGLRDTFNAYVHPCSIMIRHGVLCEFPTWVTRSHGIDHPLQVLIAEHGAIVYLEDVMATYRLHATSTWNPLGNLEKARLRIRMLQEFDDHFEGRYTDEIRTASVDPWLIIAQHYSDSMVETAEIDSNYERLRQELREHPFGVPLKKSDQDRILGEYLLNAAMSSHESGQSRDASHYMIAALRSDPALLKNRGALSVLIQNTLPSRMSRPLKSIVRKLGLGRSGT